MWASARTALSRVAAPHTAALGRHSLAACGRAAARGSAARSLCSEAEALLTSEREAMEYDVVIVGAGPAGLAAAIRLKQLETSEGREISVCVVEKAAEVGAHILSGNVFEPRALDELIPDWKEQDVLGDEATAVTGDKMVFMYSDTGSVSIPEMLIPPTLHNDGNYIISLGKLVRWLGEHAEELGVEIYPGFPAGEVLYDDAGAVVGVATADMGIGKDGRPKDTFMRGMELRAKQTLFAEGARGSCSETVIERFDLRAESDMQSYGLGLKEVWEVPEEVHQPGLVQHSFGWPMESDTYGGSFLYHQKPNKVLVGFVVGLDYANPYLSPYEEFQRFKHHPSVSKHLEGGECIAYGARVLNEGGLQAIPKLTFPGGALVGCSAGFLNNAKIKGSHTAIKSGMVAAEALYGALKPEGVEDKFMEGEEDLSAWPRVEVTEYASMMEDSWVYEELTEVRNFGPAFKWGLYGGFLYGGLELMILKGRMPWTISKHGKQRDHEFTKKASECEEIVYPKPDGVLSFDILTNLARAGTNHEGDQPTHLRIKPELASVPNSVSIKEYAGPEQRFCPAKVYEYHENDESGEMELVINAQNCVHCKCCSIKMPQEYINWTVPEGGGGPAYEVM